MTTTPPADPSIEAVAARLKAASQERAEAYAAPTDWQPIWKRPRKPKTIKAKKAELAKQRKRHHRPRLIVPRRRHGPVRFSRHHPPHLQNTRFTRHSTEEEHRTMTNTTALPRMLRFTDPGLREQLEALPASAALIGIGTNGTAIAVDLDDAPHVLVCTGTRGIACVPRARVLVCPCTRVGAKREVWPLGVRWLSGRGCVPSPGHRVR
ncbi:hypothetical protein [Streptomyces virginiae]|uniref:hypothetical protein n=1 Tax=Streptomyces virginiae TaxID=1961 RepID=UPI0030DF8E1E